MRILALNAFHGGSHRAFLDGWASRSRHQFTVLTLPAYKWKWRMRHAAISFAEQSSQHAAAGRQWDVVFCTDMLNLAEFRGLAPPMVRDLPSIVYFHENQLTYPTRQAEQRDLHFAFTNLTTALAADRVWFNSTFHRDTFLAAIGELIVRMPDFQPRAAVDEIRAKSQVHYPGIETFDVPSTRKPGSLRILWSARWEHDKNPELFFAAIDRLRSRTRDFRLSVVGESFAGVPACFDQARRQFGEHIDMWGYLTSRDDYRAALQTADVVVSTADHEFFGIAIVEAVAAGCFPLVPRRLAYPGIFGGERDFFYDGTAQALADRLCDMAAAISDPNGSLWGSDRDRGVQLVADFAWERVVPRLDGAVDGL